MTSADLQPVTGCSRRAQRQTQTLEAARSAQSRNANGKRGRVRVEGVPEPGGEGRVLLKGYPGRKEAGYLGNLAPAKSLWQLNASPWSSPVAV